MGFEQTHLEHEKMSSHSIAEASQLQIKLSSNDKSPTSKYYIPARTSLIQATTHPDQFGIVHFRKRIRDIKQPSDTQGCVEVKSWEHSKDAYGLQDRLLWKQGGKAIFTLKDDIKLPLECTDTSTGKVTRTDVLIPAETLVCLNLDEESARWFPSFSPGGGFTDYPDPGDTDTCLKDKKLILMIPTENESLDKDNGTYLKITFPDDVMHQDAGDPDTIYVPFGVRHQWEAELEWTKLPKNERGDFPVEKLDVKSRLNFGGGQLSVDLLLVSKFWDQRFCVTMTSMPPEDRRAEPGDPENPDYIADVEMHWNPHPTGEDESTQLSGRVTQFKPIHNDVDPTEYLCSVTDSVSWTAPTASSKTATV